MNDNTERQEEVLAFLADPSTYGCHKARNGAVRRIDTHAASVFLVGNRALAFPSQAGRQCSSQRPAVATK
jgi:hypothetical protein